MTILINPSRFRLGADTAVGRLLGEEPSGLAIDFQARQALIRDDASPLTQYFGDPNVLLTYTAPSTKWVCDVSGNLVSGTTLRVDHHPVSHVPLGVLSEMARINVVLHNRDLTNAAWVKTNITAAKDQTGVDGVASSASSILATAANGTCLQTVTIVASTRVQSAYVKRLTGTGTIDATQDNGTTWTPLTLTSAWVRLSNPSASVTNPIIGFRITTSGDAIAVDFVQNEIGTFATSPIATTTVAVTRAVDNIKILTSAFPYNQAACTLFVASTILGQPPAGINFQCATLNDGGLTNRVGMLAAIASTTVSAIAFVSANVTQASFVGMGAITVGSEIRLVCAGEANSFAAKSNGATALQTDTAGVMPLAATTLWIGGSQVIAEVLNGHVRKLKYLPRRAANVELQNMVA